jgi:taurine transport system ATP-binding protein
MTEHGTRQASPATAPRESVAGRAAGARHGGTDARLVISRVSHDYVTKKERIHALDPLDLALEPGDFVSLAGPSGCGKSTLLSLLAGFIFPTTGEITLRGRRIEAPSWERGVVFQQPNLYPWLSVRDNITFGPRMRGLPRSEYQQRADHFIRLVGLADFASRRPYELSGGMQQRAAIARVLVNDPAIMLMDEPFGALDALTRERMQEELLTIWRKTEKTIFFITHSVEEAVYLGTRVLVMSPRPGRVVFNQASPFSRMETSVREARVLPEFIEMEKRVSEAIYAGHS